MHRLFIILIVGAITSASCSGPESVEPPITAPTVAMSTTSIGSTTTTTTIVPSTVPATTSTVPSMPSIEDGDPTNPAAKHLENYLAALAAGAYEQAGYAMTDAGMGFGHNEDIAAPNYLAAACDEDLCHGPYEISPGDPFLEDDGMAPPRWNFIITHTPSGEVGTMTVGMFEGQFVIADLPPLVSSPEPPSLPGRLFGNMQPDYLVIERFNAYEIHEGTDPSWTTNWFADETYQVEGDFVAAGLTVDFELLVGPLSDPSAATAYACPSLIRRSGVSLVYEWCSPDGSALRSLTDDQTFPLLLDPGAVSRSEDEQAGFYDERGGVAVVTFGDAEGNTSNMVSSTGADLLDGDYAGFTTLSADGSLFVYTDHSQDSGTYNHFWSPVVVARDTATGEEVSRFLIDGPVTCLESDGRWIVVCEGSIDLIPFGDPGSAALIAYDIESGTLNRVETRTRLFLPSKG